MSPHVAASAVELKVGQIVHHTAHALCVCQVMVLGGWLALVKVKAGRGAGTTKVVPLAGLRAVGR